MDEKEKFDATTYKNQFNAQKYDRISLMVAKGDKERIADHAAKSGESLNGFINRAIREAMERDGAKE